MIKVNYSKELDKILSDSSTRGKKLYLHSCCAPCSSYVLEYLRKFFCITVFYYNPNITENAEYQKRVCEQKRLIDAFNEDCGNAYPILVEEGDYDPALFFDKVKGLEQCKEGGNRCRVCFEMRLRETAQRAAMQQMDYFTTTLSISPLKNADTINEIGQALAKEYGVSFLPSDFKKKDGYKRSIELSAKYNLYRQDYCGCAFSKAEREKERKPENA